MWREELPGGPSAGAFVVIVRKLRRQYDGGLMMDFTNLDKLKRYPVAENSKNKFVFD